MPAMIKNNHDGTYFVVDEDGAAMYNAHHIKIAAYAGADNPESYLGVELVPLGANRLEQFINAQLLQQHGVVPDVDPELLYGGGYE